MVLTHPPGDEWHEVNETMARQLWPNADAIGKRIRFYMERIHSDGFRSSVSSVMQGTGTPSPANAGDWNPVGYRATSGQIRTLMLGRGMVLNLTGIGLGVLGALALSRVTAGFVYGITPTDAWAFLVVVSLFAAVACVSTYVLARRAAKIDPAVAFRYE